MPTLADKPKLDRERLRHALDEGAVALAAAMDVLSRSFAKVADALREVSEQRDAEEAAILTRPDVQDALAVGLRELSEAREQRPEQIS